MDVSDPRFGSRMPDRDELSVQVHNIFKRFLENFSDQDIEQPEEDDSRSEAAPKVSKYSREALKLLNDDRNTLFIDFKDIELFDTNLAEDIMLEYYRFHPYLCRAVATYVREEKIRQAEAAMDPNADMIERTRERETILKDLDRPQVRAKNYYVGFYNFAQRDNIRDLTATKVGTLTRVTGQVVRTHQVHPELMVGCFQCLDCLTEHYQEQQFRYTQPPTCSNENCNNRVSFKLVMEKSRFTDQQRIRIQEIQQELPRGCIPRSFDVVVRGTDQVECIQPGDQCDFIGTLIVVPDVGQMMNGIMGTVQSELGNDSGVAGLKTMGVKEMYHSLAFLASACIIDGQSKPCINTEDDHRDAAQGSSFQFGDFTKEEILKIESMSKDPNLLDNLSNSLFSSVYGSDDVKRGIVLQLLGGVPKITSSGTKLRGDINICLVGDPSTAKSTFLKVVADFAPIKAVLASGKASSASGLTAACVRSEDGSFVIEAGALMLADRGICCIDEFDKMDLKDQVAIHEAMEQQTISITKAGVSATLNARASILAAANPIGGTYNTTRDLRSNVNFSLPIMSRFDMFFIMVDPRDEANDMQIADKILNMHMNFSDLQAKTAMVYTFEEIRLYLRFARKYYPKIPPEAVEIIESEYVNLRQNSTHNKTAWRVTVRQLESLIRLSEAIARAHCDEYVKKNHVQMAARLISKTITLVGKSELPLEEKTVNSQVSADSQPVSMSISLQRYRVMAKVLIRHLEEFAAMSETVLKSDLVDWYLKKCCDEINSEKELIELKAICEKVITRLTHVDHLIMELEEPGSDAEDPLLMVNPLLDTNEFFD